MNMGTMWRVLYLVEYNLFVIAFYTSYQNIKIKKMRDWNWEMVFSILFAISTLCMWSQGPLKLLLPVTTHGHEAFSTR